MENQFNQKARLYATLGAAMGWFAVFSQLYLIIVNRTTDVPSTIIRFLCYFTILTNIIVALCFTFIAFTQAGWLKNFFSRTTVLTAIAGYITIVGIVYNTVLRQVWNPQGLQKIVDTLLHTVVPVAYLLFWFLFVPKTTLQWKNVFSWLLYPFIYVVVILIRGAVSGLYPYPFIDVNELGYSKVLINCGILLLAFLVLPLVLIGITKLTSKQVPQ